MFRKAIFSATAVLLLGLLSVTAAAQNPGQAGMPRMARLKNFLALTDKQVADIQDLFKKHQAAALPIRQDLRARNQELRTALDTAEPNPASVGQVVILQRSLRGQLRTLNQKLQSDIAAKLSPDQQQKFSQIRERAGRRARRG